MTDKDPVAVLGGPEKAREWLSDGIHHWHTGESTYDRYGTASFRLALLGIDAAALKAENEKLRAERQEQINTAALMSDKARPYLSAGMEGKLWCDIVIEFAESEKKALAERDAALERAAEELREIRDAFLIGCDRRLAALEARPCNATTTVEGIAFGCVRSSHSDDDHAYAKAEPRAEPKPAAKPKRPGALSMIQCGDDELRELREMVACDQSVGAFGDASLDTVRNLALMLADRALGGGK